MDDQTKKQNNKHRNEAIILKWHQMDSRDYSAIQASQHQVG